MQSSIAIKRNVYIKTVIVDVLILAFIYFLPTISHLTLIPIYLIDPMRFVLIFTILFSNRTNTILMALTIPLFSYLFSAHPELNKSLIISFELMINMLAFYYIYAKSKHLFISLVLSVTIAKIIYYALKYFFIKAELIKGPLIMTPIEIQIVAIMVLSFLVSLAAKYLKNNELQKLDN